VSKPSAVDIARWAEDRARRESPESGLSRAEEWQIVTAAKRNGMTVGKLAVEFNRSESEIQRVLAAWSDTTEAARHLLRARAMELADRMMTDADPSVALDILERLTVVPPAKAAANPGLVIQIGIREEDVQFNLGPVKPVLEVSASPDPL
jgi:hypothetical protein